MDFQFSPEDEAFRLEVRDFLKHNLPPHLKRRAYYGAHGLGRPTMIEWAKILSKRGWVAPNWPKEYGGPGWTAMQRHIFDEECWAGDAPTTHFQTYLLVGPTVISSATRNRRSASCRPYWRAT